MGGKLSERVRNVIEMGSCLMAVIKVRDRITNYTIFVFFLNLQMEISTNSLVLMVRAVDIIKEQSKGPV